MSWNYRCSRPGCRQRKTLRHEMEWYLWEHKPKCPACGHDSLKFDGAVRRQTMRRTCWCRGVFFPHREGTMTPGHGICIHVPYELASEYQYELEHGPQEGQKQ